MSETRRRDCSRSPQCLARGWVTTALADLTGTSPAGPPTPTPTTAPHAVHWSFTTLEFDTMTVTESIKHAVGLDGEPRSQSCPDLSPMHDHRKVLTTTYRGYPRGDERRKASPGIPRLMRTSSYPAQPMSIRHYVPALEVRGTCRSCRKKKKHC